MDRESSGPSGVVNQLEFDLAGVAPSSREERLATWLEVQEEVTADVLTATLFLQDSRSRRERVERWAEVRSIQAPYDREEGWLVTGGDEAIWLYEESCRSYVNGMFLAALLCAHAACERVLAGCLLFYEDQLEKNWIMWGLGRLIVAAFERGLIDQRMKDNLDQVTEVRKVSAHYKHPITTPNSVSRRALRALGDDATIEDALDGVLKQDACLAVRTATELLRGDQGFYRLAP